MWNLKENSQILKDLKHILSVIYPQSVTGKEVKVLIYPPQSRMEKIWEKHLKITDKIDSNNGIFCRRIFLLI